MTTMKMHGEFAHFGRAPRPWSDDATIAAKPIGPLVWSPRRVIETAAEAFDVETNNLLGGTYRPLAHYRMVTYAAVKRFCGLSYLQTSKVFHRDHTTVISGIKRVESDPELSHLYGLLAERLLVEGVA